MGVWFHPGSGFWDDFRARSEPARISSFTPFPFSVNRLKFGSTAIERHAEEAVCPFVLTIR
jgi:hypothetical protein